MQQNIIEREGVSTGFVCAAICSPYGAPTPSATPTSRPIGDDRDDSGQKPAPTLRATGVNSRNLNVGANIGGDVDMTKERRADTGASGNGGLSSAHGEDSVSARHWHRRKLALRSTPVYTGVLAGVNRRLPSGLKSIGVAITGRRRDSRAPHLRDNLRDCCANGRT